MSDDRERDERPLDRTIRERARLEYHAPPATPRDAIWAGLEARLDAEGGRLEMGGAAPVTDLVLARELRARRPRRSRPATSSEGNGLRWVGLAVAASATLLLGVGIGRMTAPAGPGATPARVVAAPMDGTGDGAGVRAVAATHLAASESLLSFVQADARTGRFDRTVGRWGRELLLETRLLLDSEASRDPALRELLEDLELILAQVAVLADTEAPARGREELLLIARGVRDQDMMTRLQTALPGVAAGLSGT